MGIRIMRANRGAPKGSDAITAKKKGLAFANPLIFGEPCRDRTDNLLIKSQLLYQLS